MFRNGNIDHEIVIWLLAKDNWHSLIDELYSLSGIINEVREFLDDLMLDEDMKV